MKTAMEMLDRMEALVRRMAKQAGKGQDAMSGLDYYEASAIVAEMPAPVDPDLLKARELAAFAVKEIGLKSGWPSHSAELGYRSGVADKGAVIPRIVEALKNARQGK